MLSNTRHGNAGDKSVKWDDYFDDPSDDLVIVAQDGVHFRVSSYRLSKSRYVSADSLKLRAWLTRV